MILDIATKEGKTFHITLTAESENVLQGKKIGDTLDGSLLDKKFSGFKLQITGLSNISGFPARRDVDGTTLKRVLLVKGVGFKGKGGRMKKTRKIKGMRKRRTIRGNAIAQDITQVNVKILEGDGKKLAEMFGKSEAKEQNEKNEKSE